MGSSAGLKPGPEEAHEITSDGLKAAVAMGLPVPFRLDQRLPARQEVREGPAAVGQGGPSAPDGLVREAKISQTGEDCSPAG